MTIDKPSAQPLPESLPFVGWRRARGERWQPVCQGLTNSQCFELLMEIIDQTPAGTHSDTIILPRGQEP